MLRGGGGGGGELSLGLVVVLLDGLGLGDVGSVDLLLGDPGMDVLSGWWWALMGCGNCRRGSQPLLVRAHVDEAAVGALAPVLLLLLLGETHRRWGLLGETHLRWGLLPHHEFLLLRGHLLGHGLGEPSLETRIPTISTARRGMPITESDTHQSIGGRTT